MKKTRKYVNYLKNRIRNNRQTFLVYSVLRILVIAVLIRQLWWGNYESAVVCAFSLLLFLVPSFMEDHLKIEIPPLFESIIYIFIFAAEILGEVDHFYVAIPGWDTMLHTINGFLAAAIGFSMIDLLNRHKGRIKLSPLYLAMMAFCFSMTVGVVWEFIEFAGDMYFGQDMQKDFIVQSFQSVTLDPTNSQQVISVKGITDTVIHTTSGDVVIDGGYLDIGIIDTMKDLFVNMIGAIVFSVFGYIYAKGRANRQSIPVRVATGLMVRVAKEQDQVLEIDIKEKSENVADS